MRGRERAESIRQQTHEPFARAQVVIVFCPGVSGASGESATGASAQPTANSLVQVIEFCNSRQGPYLERDRSATSRAPETVTWSTVQPARSQVARHKLVRIIANEWQVRRCV
jgi:hypothetical protein